MDVELVSGGGTPGPCAGFHPRPRGPVRHHVAEARAWPWLPVEGHGHLAKHPYCQACGQIAAVGGERALDAGGLANLLGRLERRLADHGLKVTEAHKRLVMRRLRQLAADDPFGQRRETQVKIISAVVAPMVGLTPGAIESYVRSC